MFEGTHQPYDAGDVEAVTTHHARQVVYYLARMVAARAVDDDRPGAAAEVNALPHRLGAEARELAWIVDAPDRTLPIVMAGPEQRQRFGFLAPQHLPELAEPQCEQSTTP